MPEAEDLIGTTIAGKYSLRRLLGVGGMGAVYEGQHLEIGKRVAVKIVTEQTGVDAGEVSQRFRREARAASAVESEHIVQVFDVGHDPAAGLYMVMEYLEGEDLSTRLAREGRLDTTSAILMASQALRGLAKAHAAGVVHRDLKPANIYLMTREDGSMLVKILDFGISKFVREETTEGTEKANQKLTRVGSVLGTPQYMSPEQAQGLATVDHRSDIWAMGAVVYEALAGRAAYEEHATYEQTIIKIVTTLAPRLIDVAPWVPQEVSDVIHVALQHDIAARHVDCVAFVRALNEAFPHLGPDASVRLAGISEGRILAAAEARLKSAVAVTAEGAAAVAVRHDGKSGTTTGLVSNMPMLSDPPEIPGVRKRGRGVMPIAIGLVGFVAIAGGVLTMRNRNVVSNASANAVSSEVAASAAAGGRPIESDHLSLPNVVAPVEAKPRETPAAPPAVVANAAPAGDPASKPSTKAPSTKGHAAPGAKAGSPVPPAASHAPEKKGDDAAKDPAKGGSTKRFGGVDLSDSYD